MSKAIKFNTISDCIAAIQNGEMVIVVDDEDRENEGDLVMAAHFATQSNINFMIKHGKGLVCVPLTDKLLGTLELKNMVETNEDHMNTAFMVSIDASKAHGISTGISASDRAKTIQLLINPKATRKDFSAPGHVFPLRAREMGVLRRSGHTEAAVDLARLAELEPAGVICEIIKENGEMARVPDLMKFAKKHDLKIMTIKDLINYRIKKEKFVKRIEKTKLPTAFGHFDLYCYEDIINNKYHMAIVKGNVKKEKNVFVRVHSECLTGDIFHSSRCDCGDQLHSAMQMIEDKGCGVVLYMRQEGRGIGIANKIKAYKLQDDGLDTIEANKKLGFPADLRDYGVGAQILLDLGVKNIDLITNNPTKIVGLEGYGLKIHKRVPLIIEPSEHNTGYLKTKAEKMGHLINET